MRVSSYQVQGVWKVIVLVVIGVIGVRVRVRVSDGREGRDRRYLDCAPAAPLLLPSPLPLLLSSDTPSSSSSSSSSS